MLAPSPPEDPRNIAETIRLPHNIEVEQALLGAILWNNDTIERVPFLKPGHFYDQLHSDIFDVAGKLIATGKQASPITMRMFFENTEPLTSEMTVPQYLGHLVANVPSMANVKDYGRIVYDLALRRALITIGEDMVTGAIDAATDIPPSDLIEEAESALYVVAETGKDQPVVSMRDAVNEAVETANRNYKRQGSGGLATGLVDLDKMLGGLQPSDLLIIAGRPSMGKTALVTNIARNVAAAGRHHVDDNGEIRRETSPVLFFSLEMAAEQLSARLIAEEAQIPSDKSRRGTMTETEINDYIRASETIARLPIWIDATGGLSIAQMATRARRVKRQKGICLVIVDYLQLMSGTGRSGDNRVQEITQITTGLKALAKELNVPILALSQLSRNVEGRENKRPQLSDLRESGSIEQDADAVMFVFREEYYVERLKPDESNFEKLVEWQKKLASCQGKAEIIIGKQRHGPVGTVEVAFESQFTRFGNLAKGGNYAP